MAIKPLGGELAVASKRVDCIMVYIYCTNTVSGPFCLSHQAHIQISMETAEGEEVKIVCKLPTIG